MEIFLEMPCLTERSETLTTLELDKKWGKLPDKRNITKYLFDFQHINESALSFIGIVPKIIIQNNETSIFFTSTKYVGAVPLRSPINGKQSGDLIVKPRYINKSGFHEFSEIINLLGNNINFETFNNELILKSRGNFHPPLYLEAIKFINALEYLIKINWVKFSVIKKNSKIVKGNVNWNSYLQQSYKVEKHIEFPIQTSVISFDHSEYKQMRFVFDICKNEIFSSKTPENIKRIYKNRIEILNNKFYNIQPQKVNHFPVRPLDKSAVKECKDLANNILRNNQKDLIGWRVDISEVFEKFVQHIFKELKFNIGGHLSENERFKQTRSNRFDWSLNHLEPDLIFRHEKKTYFIDAKYKVNLYNYRNNSEILKELHRKDLHQIIAYSAFSNSIEKYAMICYPSNEPKIDELEYLNSENGVSILVYILGIPMNSALIQNTLDLLKNHFLSTRIEE
jgi:hypothetical protein